MRVLIAMLLMSSAAAAFDGTPTDDQKINALKEAYRMNGNSMVRWGSIDMTGFFKSDDPRIVITPETEFNVLDMAVKKEKQKKK